MSFTYAPGRRLRDVLIDALDYAKSGEDAIFIFQGKNIIVTKRSNLAAIWSKYYDTQEGRTAGPCEEAFDTINVPKGYNEWSRERREAAMGIIRDLLEASR